MAGTKNDHPLFVLLQRTAGREQHLQEQVARLFLTRDLFPVWADCVEQDPRSILPSSLYALIILWEKCKDPDQGVRNNSSPAHTHLLP